MTHLRDNSQRLLIIPFRIIFILFFAALALTVETAHSDPSPQFTKDRVKADFEKLVDNYQDEGLSPSVIAARIMKQMTLLIERTARRGFTLEQIIAIVETAAKGALDGCQSQPAGYNFKPNGNKVHCTSRPESPLGSCTAAALQLAEGAKAGAARVGMNQTQKSRLINAVGAASGWCVKVGTHSMALTQEEKDSMGRDADSARQAPRNVTNPPMQ